MRNSCCRCFRKDATSAELLPGASPSTSSSARTIRHVLPGSTRAHPPVASGEWDEAITRHEQVRSSDLLPGSTRQAICPTTCTTVLGMAQRHKRSISLPPDLDESIERAAAAAGTSVSGWIADVAEHRLRIEAGRRGVAQWEREHGALTADELAEGLARARLALGRRSARVRRTA